MRHKLSVLAATITFAFFVQPLTAQDSTGGRVCDPNQTSPEYIAMATFSMNRAFIALKGGPPAPDTAAKKADAPNTPIVPLDPKRDLMAAITSLTTIPKKKPKDENLLGKNFILAQAYILLMQQPGVEPIMKRGDVGIATDPEGMVDLFAAADSSISYVETNAPQCASFMSQWRQQKPWMLTLNASMAALNSGKFDSAEYLVNRSMILDRVNPYAYLVLAGIAKGRKDYPKANEYWMKTLEAAGTDTGYVDIRTKVIFDMASTASSLVDAAAPAQRPPLARTAIEAWHRYLASASNDYMIANANQQLVKMYIVAGDSLKIPEIYAPMLAAAPGKYGEVSLVNAGILAMRFKKTRDAVKLFEAALVANPYSRDALNSLAASYVGVNEYEKMFPIVERLVSIDPNNPDNWSLYTYAYSGYLKNPKSAALTKAYTDSMVKYNAKAEQMPVRVTFNEFSRGETEITIAGSIENRGKVSQTYNITVELLDKDGKVVGTQSASVGPVSAKDSGDFAVTLPITEGMGTVVGFRYKPLT